LRQRFQRRESAGRFGIVKTELADGSRYSTRQGWIITDLVSTLLSVEERFVVLDAGAREAFGDPRWRVFDKKRVRLFGFEPDAKEVEALNREAAHLGVDYQYYASALWSQQGHATYIANRSPGGGSFFEQNLDLTDRWKFENVEAKFLARDIFHPLGKEDWVVTSVDAWASENAIVDVDFMKLNVQGAELEILKGAGKLLSRVTGIMVEMSFVESYKNRPFFSDIDSFLRAQNFTFFDFIGHHLIGRARSPITATQTPGLYPLHGQLIEGHGIYFRDPIDMEKRGLDLDLYGKAKLLKLACFAEIFGQVEFAFELLAWIADTQARRGDDAGAGEVRALVSEAESLYRRVLGAR